MNEIPGLSFDDKQRNPISAGMAARLHADPTYSIIGKHRCVEGSTEVEVSTVWLGGVNHCWSIDVGITLFETMIFGGDYDGEVTRYDYEDHALRGHVQCMFDLREGRSPWWVRDVDVSTLPDVCDAEANLRELTGGFDE